MTTAPFPEKSGKQVFDELWRGDDSADDIIERLGLKQISDSGAIETMVDEVIAANPTQLAEYRAGKEKLLSFFIGAVMKASRGKANPAQLNQLLRERAQSGLTGQARSLAERPPFAVPGQVRLARDRWRVAYASRFWVELTNRFCLIRTSTLALRDPYRYIAEVVVKQNNIRERQSGAELTEQQCGSAAQ